jgi:energy-coupling factor transporter ATP-binding protein EcfA2
MTASPFSYTRYEYEGRHLYFVPDDLRRQLERSVPLFIIGSRGTGKTTLLRYLNWHERVHNTELRSQLEGTPFSPGIIGTYLRLPSVQLAMFERWLRDEEDETYGAIFSTYLELSCLELMIDAILGLADADFIAPSVDAEGEVAHRVAEAIRPGSTASSLAQCGRLARDVRRRLDRLARERTTASAAFEDSGVGEAFGATLRSVSPVLVRLCDEFAKEDVSQGWSFRLCLDEAEALSERQQLSLNSIVRLSEWPTFPVAAYVAPPSDDRRTLLPNLGIQRADLEYVVRDEVSDKEFEALVDGIARLRLQRGLSEAGQDEPKASGYGVRRQLGSLRINRLLERILSRSESQFASDLLNRARQGMEDVESAAPSSDETAGIDPPIYETYLIDRLQLSTPDSPKQRRRFSSEELRKKMVAAYLSICSEVGARPEYAFADMALQTCDKCIRDFLWEMDAIFERADMSLQRFAEARGVGIDIQSSALRAASESKLARLPKLIEAAPSEAQALVEGLGELTATIQGSDPDDRHLASTERGRFVVQLDSGNQVGRALAEIIEDAAEWGFLKMLEVADSRWEFRVHTSLAPLYGFSYRGAYYPYSLMEHEIEQLARAADARERKDVVSRIVSRVAGPPKDDTQQELRLNG